MDNARTEWLARRLSGIGASDAAAVLGVSPWKSPLQLYCEKLKIAEAPQEETEAMEWGLLLEPVIADRYARETGRQRKRLPPFTIRQSATWPFMLATLDDEIEAMDSRGPGVLEVKTAGAHKASEWADEPPIFYQIQLQHQLAVTDYAWGSLAVLLGGQKFRWMDMERNDQFIGLLVEREREFWDRVLHHDPPAPDASASAKEMLRRLYPNDSGASVALPAEALEWDQRRMEALEELKRWEAVKDEAENLLKASIGDATLGALSSGVSYSWKTSPRNGYAVKPTTVRTLRRIA